MLISSILFADMYSSLAPRLGQTSFAASSIGTADLRGGKINWGSLGSSLSNAFKSTTKYIGNAASKFAKSQAYQDIKKGIHDSGLVRNVAGLAGDALNSLVDIGRMKLENDLLNLRRKAMKTIPADQLAQILLNYHQTHDVITPPDNSTAIPLPPPPQPTLGTVFPAAVVEETTKKRPMIEEVEEVQPEAGDLVEPVAVLPTPVPFKRGRIRGSGESEWQAHLNSMLGQGVRYSSTKRCY